MNKKNQQLLLTLARGILEASFKDEDPDISEYMHLTQLRGCFVTLHKNNQLRGCIGFPRPIMPLYEQIIAATKAAAFEDPRFTPLSEDELKDITIEISILTRPEIIKVNDPKEYIEKIEAGRDGLIIQGESSGLLLPQVATEYKMNAKQFLETLSEKADLEKDAWKNPANKIYKFHAEIFSEKE